MNAPSLRALPLSPAAHALLRSRFDPRDDVRNAAVDFGPWELADLCDVPAETWRTRPREMLVTLRLASELVRLDKATLVDRLDAMEGSGLDELIDATRRWVDTFRLQLATLEALEDRMVVALAVQHMRQRAEEAQDLGGAA